MSDYIFGTKTEDRELGRLRMIETATDPQSIKLLQGTGIREGWKCLELGPGAGSILEWMGKTVGQEGLVIGVNKKITYLHEFSVLPYDIREGDFLDIRLDTPLDLMHGRYVLIHNKKDMEILRQTYDLLKPGGYAVFEEPNFTSAKLLNDSSDISHQNVNSATCKMFEGLGLDPGYGISLPKKLRTVGFHIVEIHSTIHLCHGNSPFANLMAESVSALKQEYLATGEATEQDISHYRRNAHDSEYWSVYYSTISVITKTPA